MNPMRAFGATILCGTLLALPGATQSRRPLTFEGLLSFGRVADPQISPDGAWVSYSITRYDLDTNAGDSDVWLVPLAGGAARQQTQSNKRDNGARWASDGKRIAFISSRDGTPQIYIMQMPGGEARKLTSLSTGADGVVWAPNGQLLAFTSDVYPQCADDSCNERREQEAESAKVKARIFDSLLYRHWDSWKDGKRTHIFVVSSDGGTPTDLTSGDFDSPPFSLGGPTDYNFSPDSSELCFARNADKVGATSTNSDLWLVPVTGGTPRRITTNPAYDGAPAYSPDGKYIAYRSQRRAGFEADRFEIMLYDRANGSTRSLTPAFDRSAGAVTWAPDSRSIYFAAEDEGFSSIYRLSIAGGEPVRIIGNSFNDDVQLSRDGKTMVFTRQSISRPVEIFASDVAGQKVTQLTGTNTAVLASIDFGPVESVQYTGAEGQSIQAWLVKPPAFSAERKWPVVVLIHGGPQGSWSDNFSYRWNLQMFASRGYIVFAPNPRGSTGFGQKLTDEISGDWGGKVFTDVMNGVDFVSKLPYVDAARISAAGASYGGYMMNWLEGHTNRFRCIVSHDGVFNTASMFGSTEELWFPMWEFRGTPWDNAALYAKWSPSNYVKQFKTPMLVVHGARDYRVPDTQGFELFTALQLMNVPSKFLYFPDEGHWVLKPQNSRLWYATVLDWIDQWTKSSTQ
jgi:dipeptidyl aminopeptidase/acylaminoacyl peptidase